MCEMQGLKGTTYSKDEGRQRGAGVTLNMKGVHTFLRSRDQGIGIQLRAFVQEYQKGETTMMLLCIRNH